MAPFHQQSWSQDFLGLPPDADRIEAGQVAILPIPYDLTMSYQTGARRGPQAILEASQYVELYDDELAGEHHTGIWTLPPLEPTAKGPEAMTGTIEQAMGKLLKAGVFPISIGGDHSVTHGLVRAVAKHFDEFSVLQLDAHADLRDEYHGTPWSHACVGRRICEVAPLVQMGIRSFSSEEAAYMAEQDRTITLTASQMRQDSQAVEAALATLKKPVYITLDLDVFDPAFMPATGTPEPGGLDWYAVTALLRRTFEMHQVIGCDVVELAPIPGLVAPDFLAAKLIYKMIGYRSAYGQP